MFLLADMELPDWLIKHTELLTKKMLILLSNSTYFDLEKSCFFKL